jgi:hypothetical protein
MNNIYVCIYINLYMYIHIYIGLRVERSQLAPDMKLSQEDLFSCISKNPNQSVRDYEEKFTHNIPMPVVLKGDVVFTLEGRKVYYNLLVQLIKLDEKVDIRDADFLRLIMDHIQSFERYIYMYICVYACT